MKTTKATKIRHGFARTDAQADLDNPNGSFARLPEGAKLVLMTAAHHWVDSHWVSDGDAPDEEFWFDVIAEDEWPSQYGEHIGTVRGDSGGIFHLLRKKV